MSALIVTATLTTLALLLDTAHRRRWWPPLSTPAVLTGFAWLAAALSCIPAAIEAAAHEPDQPAAYSVPLVLMAILPLLKALTTGGPAIVYSLYREAVALERDQSNARPQP